MNDWAFGIGTAVVGAALVLGGRAWLRRDRTPKPLTDEQISAREARDAAYRENFSPSAIAARNRQWEAAEKLRREREEEAHRRAVELARASGLPEPPPLPPRNPLPPTK